MEQRFSVEGGQLLCREQGGRVTVQMQVRPPGRGLYHGLLAGPGGTWDLGPLLPQGDRLTLAQTLEVPALQARGCWPIIGARLRQTHAFGQKPSAGAWREAGDLAALFPEDPLLARAAAGQRALVCRDRSGGFSLAFPWEPREPFPLVPVFCFARVCPLRGRLHLVVSFGPNGQPVLPGPGLAPCQNGETAIQ